MRALLLVLLPFTTIAQFSYRIDNAIPVTAGDSTLSLAWSGGLNSVQVNTIDLNGDGANDLALFDKMASRITTLVADGDAYRAAPEFESFFPAEISTFVLLRDFDNDGRKDLFTFGQIGVFVFRNTSVPGGPPSWSKLAFYNPATQQKSEVLLTTGFSGKINLLPGSSDIPHFGDMDGDGDLDVLNMRFVTPGTAEYHKNFSMELYGIPDSLELVRQTSAWGDFIECGCGKIAFGGQTCADIGGRINHTGGKALLALDYDNDGDQDLIFSEESCAHLYYMENTGDANTPVLTGFQLFPPSQPVGISIFPAPYLEDVNHDGKKELLVSPGVSQRMDPYNDFRQSLLYYRNDGTPGAPDFQWVQDNFLQSKMIDVGDLSSPAFADIDNDGDLDLFIGNFTNTYGRGSIAFYRNTGTENLPSFSWVTDDYLNLRFFSLTNIRLQFADINRDGSLDLAFTATNTFNGTTRAYYIPNTSSSGFDLDPLTMITLSISIGPNENLSWADVDLDGWPDYLLGTSTGSLQYWRNQGNNSFTLQDDSFLGLAPSTSRLYLSAFVEDLDYDGQADIVIGDHLGTLGVIGSFRTNPNGSANTALIYNSLSDAYGTHNLGGRLRVTAARLYGNGKPEVVTGNAQGGIHVLKPDNGMPFSDKPSIVVYPNPISSGFPLQVKSDRNATMDIFTPLGQHIGTTQFVPANQVISYPLQGIAAGVYMARFKYESGSVGIRFVVYQ